MSVSTDLLRNSSLLLALGGQMPMCKQPKSQCGRPTQYICLCQHQWQLCLISSEWCLIWCCQIAIIVIVISVVVVVIWFIFYINRRILQISPVCDFSTIFFGQKLQCKQTVTLYWHCLTNAIWFTCLHCVFLLFGMARTLLEQTDKHQ